MTHIQLMEYNDASPNALFRRRQKRTLNEMNKQKQFNENAKT